MHIIPMKFVLRSLGFWFLASILVFGIGIQSSRPLISKTQADNLQFDEQEATIRAIKKVSPAVVSIAVSDMVEVETKLEDGTVKKEMKKVNRGSGSGFIISANGFIITNRHIASAASRDRGEYKVTLQSGKQYYAQFIGNDPLHDLSLLKIFDSNLPSVTLGDSSKLTVGTTVIAIGNSLGRYNNSATKGIISGLYRNIEAFGNNGTSEDLKNVMQTDAEINLGNSGGPLIDLQGNVIGINVAKDLSGNSVGFSIPINEAKPIIMSARTYGRIIRARLGVRFVMITPEIAEERQTSRSSGALLIVSDKGEAAITPGGPAEKVGLQANDIIFEIDGRPIDERLPLSSYINQFSPGKKLGLRIQRGQEVFTKIVTLDEFK